MVRFRVVDLGALGLVVALGSCMLDRTGALEPGAGGNRASGGGGSSPSTTTAGGAGGIASAGGGGQGGIAEGGQGGQGGQGGSPMPVCGDGTTDPGEECDDANLEPADGCSATCTSENRDSCDDAPIISVGATVVTVTGDTSGASDEVTTASGEGNCVADTYPGADHVFVVVAAVAGELTAVLDADFSNHFLHARSSCPGSDDLDCEYESSSSSDAEISFDVEMGASYYVIVDSWDATEGGYALELSIDTSR